MKKKMSNSLIDSEVLEYRPRTASMLSSVSELEE